MRFFSAFLLALSFAAQGATLRFNREIASIIHRYFFKQLVPLPQGTRLDVEIHWDNSAENPRNPSSPPVRVTWGEESKDEMGSISLIAVPHQESDREALQGDLARRQNEFVHARLQADPSLMGKVAKLLAE